MPVNLYEGFRNEIAGETFRCISFNNKAFIFDWVVEPNGYVPFEHIHLKQDEVFYVESGEMQITIAGREYIVAEGETITVPRGMPHIARNNKPSRLHCVVQYLPGLDTYTLFQCFGGLTMDKDTTSNGTVNIPKMLYFTKKMKAQCVTRPTSIPAAFFYLAANFFFMLGAVLGWRKSFMKYTGEGVGL